MEESGKKKYNVQFQPTGLQVQVPIGTVLLDAAHRAGVYLNSVCGGDGYCGKCKVMSSQERLNIMVKGLRDMCAAMDVFVVGGGFSTSFSDIVPAVVVSVIGKLVTKKPLTKPAKKAGDKIIIIEDDDYYAPTYIEEMSTRLVHHEVVGIAGGVIGCRMGRLAGARGIG